MIAVEKLSKFYGHVKAVHDVSFEVAKGEVVGFLGPNGAGKSTTLRIVVGFLGATSGRVVIDGCDLAEHPILARSRIGYMPENVPLYPELRVREYLRFRAEAKGVRRSERTAAVTKAMKSARIDDHAEVIIGKLSKGYRQRVGLADALVASPPVLVLDEPTAGLDPNQIREIRGLIRQLGTDHTVLLSTHILSEVEATCDRALVINRGKLVAQGTLEELGRLRRSKSTRFVLRGSPEQATKVLRGCPQIAELKQAKESNQEAIVFEVAWKDAPHDVAVAVEEAVAALVAAGLGVREASPSRASLEEVFAVLTRDEAGAQERDGQEDTR